MRQFDSLKGITRRELQINYRSPLICGISVPFSVSGTGEISCIPIFRRPGPTGLVVTSPACESIQLTWDADVLALGYTVSRADSEDGPFVPVSDLILVAEFLDSVSEGTYFYRVHSVFADTGSSDPSNALVAVESC